MSDGLHIRWRETAPDQGLLAFALAELDVLHSTWPETLQCNIVIARVPNVVPDEPRYQTEVELNLGRRSPRVKAEARGEDLYVALRSAFGDLRDAMPTYAGVAA